jgi:hypothetical protein
LPLAGGTGALLPLAGGTGAVYARNQVSREA